jgi:hypothetical protein
MAGFTDFDTTVSGQWKASAAQVGSQNTVFLGLNVDGGHPNGIGPGAQDTIIWSTRRYVTSRGPVSVVVEFFCTDFLPYNPKAAGATAHVLVNGVEAQSATSRNVDDVPRLAAIVVFDAGAILDFAADPHGAPPFSENEWSARADGFTFHARVYDYPCASAADCGDIGCVFGVCCDPLVHACPDGGVVDSGIADSGVEDAGVGDSGVFDAGGFDAGHDDAGFADAGEVDAGVPDAGSTEPEVVDARIEDRPDNRRLHVGCGCGSVNALLPMVMLALIGFASRRARQRL